MNIDYGGRRQKVVQAYLGLASVWTEQRRISMTRLVVLEVSSCHERRREPARKYEDFQINFTITNQDESEVLSIFDLAEAKSTESSTFLFHGSYRPSARRDDLGRTDFRRQIDRERRQRNLEVQVTCAPQYVRMAKKSKRSRGCLAGPRGSVFVCRLRDVFPCGYMLFWRKTSGNRDLQIYRKFSLCSRLCEKEISKEVRRLQFCQICGGCRARAYAKLTKRVSGTRCPICNLVN